MIIKCKPVFNFQSLEFEMDVDPENEESINQVFDIYDKMLTGLQAIAPEQQIIKAPTPKAKPKEPMSTENQQNYLLGLGVPIEDSKRMTKKEASNMIKELS